MKKSVEERKISFYEQYIKRPQDFILALTALFLLSPIIFFVAILVKLKIGSPIIFRQQRPGYHEKIFTLYKFRTMSNDRDRDGNLMPDEKRLSNFGKILRSTSLDELPELINIIKGDMSIVGPRPLLKRYLPLYTEEQHRRHRVRPGLTGLAQIYGRNMISWDKKFYWDLEYIKKITFLNDWRIIFKTVLKVLNREDISSLSSDTMEEFKGNQEGGDELPSRTESLKFKNSRKLK